MPRRPVISVVGALLLAACLAATARSAAFEPSPSVYRLKIGGCHFAPAERILTGFRVAGKQGIVTALHGVVDCANINAVPDGSGQPFLGLTLRDVDVAHDVAVLSSPELDAAPLTGLPVVAELESQYEDLTLLGYPLGLDKQLPTMDVKVTDKAQLENFIPASQDRTTLRQRMSPDLSIQVLSVRAHVLPGHSGAPLLDASGSVVGVANGGLEGGTVEIAWAIAWPDIDWRPVSDGAVAAALRMLSQDNPQAVPLFAGTFSREVTSDDYFTGKVVDFKTKEPIEDVEITVTYAGRYDFGYSDSGGVFAFPYDAGSEKFVTVLVEAAGYEPQRRTFTGASVAGSHELRLEPLAERMTELFNVAVAEIGEIAGAASSAVASSDGQLMSKMVFDQLSAGYADRPDLTGLVGLRHAGGVLLEGSTPEERQAAAAALAQRLNADVVVYGNIDTSARPAQFRPEFYVSPSLMGAEESTGPNAFGAPVTLRLPLTDRPDNRVLLAREFIPRIEALTAFMFGLAYFKADIPDAALEQFESARAVAAWPDEPKQGKEVLYLWMGSALLKRALQGDIAGDSPCPLDDSTNDDWACAQAAYEYSLELNPQFARAHIGLGKLWADCAKQVRAGTEVTDCQAYLNSVAEQTKALAPGKDAAATAFVPLKAHYNVGLAYANSYRDQCGDEYYPLAVANLELATAEYEKNPAAPLVRELGSRAFYQLGLVHMYAGSYSVAADAFNQVIALATPAPGAYDDPWQDIRWLAYLQLGAAVAELAKAGQPNQWEKALVAYRAVTTRFEEGKYFDAAVVGAAYRGVGVVTIARGDPHAALEPLQTSISLVERADPNQQEALNPLPWVSYVALGDAYSALAQDDPTRWSDSLAAYTRVIEVFTGGAVLVDGTAAAAAYFGAGQVYEAQGDAAQAITAYTNALAIPAVTQDVARHARERLQALQ